MIAIAYTISIKTGKLIKTCSQQKTFGGFLIDLHVNLLAGDPGMNIVGISGIALMSMGMTIDDPRNSSLAAAIINAQYILHIGHYGGWLTRSLYFIVGLTPLGLLVSGLLIWQQRRWKQARQQELRQLIERSHPSMEKQR